MEGMTCVCYHRTKEGGTRFVYSTRFTTQPSLSTMHLTQEQEAGYFSCCRQANEATDPNAHANTVSLPHHICPSDIEWSYKRMRTTRRIVVLCSYAL